MTILVTGGAGFIGSHVADALLADGHEVHILDDLSNGYRENIHPEALFHEADINDALIGRLFARYRYDILVHLAAQMDVRRSVSDPVFDARVNILGLLNLMEAGRMHGLKHVVFSSSGGAMYGEPERIPQDETHVERPRSPYGVSKLVSERYLDYYEAVHGITYVALRYANVYGPRQTPEGDAGVVAIFIGRLLENEPVTIYGAGRQTRDYVFVDDVVRANMLALKHPRSGIFNIGTGIETSVLDLYEAVAGLLNTNPGHRFANARTGEVNRSALDPARAADILEWRPAVGLREGLSRTIQWFKSRTQP